MVIEDDKINDPRLMLIFNFLFNFTNLHCLQFYGRILHLKERWMHVEEIKLLSLPLIIPKSKNCLNDERERGVQFVEISIFFCKNKA